MSAPASHGPAQARPQDPAHPRPQGTLVPLPARAGAVRTVAELVDAGLAAAPDRAALERVIARYALAIPPTLLAAMAGEGLAATGTEATDPLVRQFVPSPAELHVTAEERADPIGDAAHMPVAGLVHRYPDRVLLKAVSVCAVYCRFCFRREMVGPGGESALSPQALDAALAYIKAHEAIWEVILTGGDPFMLAPRRMAEITARLAAIDHVNVLRFHTRVPIAAPERVTADLIAALKPHGATPYVAIHANHVRELTPDARRAIAALADAGIPLLSQSVLLRGVNDDAATLAELFRALVALRVKPYYLHHPDLAPGTSHFRLPITEGQAIMRALRGRLSGMALPTYVLDIPGGAGKVPLTPSYLGEVDGTMMVSDPDGALHAYPPQTSQPER